MDNTPQPTSILEFEDDHLNKAVFMDMAKWARMLSVIGIIGMGLFVLVLLGFGSTLLLYFDQIMNQPGMTGNFAMMGMGLGVLVFAIVAGIFGTLFYFLFRGATRIRRGIALDDQGVLNSGLTFLRNYFVMWAVISVLSLLSTVITFF